MGSTKDEHEKAILKIIKENNIMFIEHIWNYYFRLRKSQFYNLELEKSEAIRAAIDNNRAKEVNKMLNNWFENKNSTLQIAAMRLICTPEQRQMLNQQYIEMKAEVAERRELSLQEAKAAIEKLKDI
jgi:tyrosine-protein phosphatase YwqE